MEIAFGRPSLPRTRQHRPAGYHPASGLWKPFKRSSRCGLTSKIHAVVDTNGFRSFVAMQRHRIRT